MNSDEKIIQKIGGATEHDYLKFKEEIEYINRNIMPLFFLLGLSIEDKEAVTNALFYPNRWEAIYVELFTEKFRSGIVKPETILSPKTLEEREETPEERERRIEREVHRRLKYIYKSKYKQFLEMYKPEKNPIYDKRHLELFQEAIILTPSGLSTDVNRFIYLYSSYMEALGSTTYKLHQEVAETINRFFNGAVEITEEELNKYFILRYGIVMPNPDAINRESYARLGYKGKE